ncbi:MAG: hypothetical protein IPM24_21155 [Bryobacterales bacterium]|nr:hypothetical protein [Bryobacterales bacterium]
MIYELTRDAITKLDQTTFGSQAISERGDLQRLFKQHIDVIAPDTLIIAEEFCEWDESKRRIDLLALDREANLVVIELKRTEDGGHMELQAIRYAAMISAMTWTKAVEIFGRYLAASRIDGEAEALILEFLGWDEPNEDNFAQDVRIVLVSAEFSKEITTSVIWLNSHGLDIRCVRLRPYLLDARVLLDVQQIIPLPEADAFTVQLKKKVQEQRIARAFNPDFTKYDLTAGDQILKRLTKRALALAVVRHGMALGLTPQQVASVIPPGRWISVEGETSAEEFQAKAASLETKFGGRYDLRRFFWEDDELIRAGGRTYALTNQWGLHGLSKIDELIALLPPGTLHYEKSAE